MKCWKKTLRKDPYEMNNLYGIKGYAELRKQPGKLIDEYEDEDARKIVTANKL